MRYLIVRKRTYRDVVLPFYRDTSFSDTPDQRPDFASIDTTLYPGIFEADPWQAEMFEGWNNYPKYRLDGDALVPYDWRMNEGFKKAIRRERIDRQLQFKSIRKSTELKWIRLALVSIIGKLEQGGIDFSGDAAVSGFLDLSRFIEEHISELSKETVLPTIDLDAENGTA